MRRTIRKRIRHTGDGVNLVADLNAEVVVNVGRSTARSTTPRAAEEPPAATAPGEDAPAEGRHVDGTDPGGTQR
jgi:hypothetical protein